MVNTPTLSQIKNGLKNAILQIQKSNGFSIDLPPDHVYTINQQVTINSKDPQDYPKIIFTLDSGQNEKGASRNFFTDVRYGITFILREEFTEDPSNPPIDWVPVSEQIQLLVGDVEKALINDNTLGGIAEIVTPIDYETDSDQAYPEGILVYYVIINYRRII